MKKNSGKLLFYFIWFYELNKWGGKRAKEQSTVKPANILSWPLSLPLRKIPQTRNFEFILHFPLSEQNQPLSTIELVFKLSRNFEESSGVFFQLSSHCRNIEYRADKGANILILFWIREIEAGFLSGIEAETTLFMCVSFFWAMCVGM